MVIYLFLYLESPLLIENGTFSWGEEETVLRDINVRIDRSNLAAVVGTVGSGIHLICVN